MGESKSSGGTSATGLFLSMVALGAGAYHGYCTAQGIPINSEKIHWAVTYGPTVLKTTVYGAIAGLVGLVGGGAIGATSGWCDSALERLAKGAGGAAVGTVAGATLGAAGGAISGAVQTLIGYGVGYAAGKMLQ